MSYEDDRRCKMGLLGPKNPKIIFSGRSWPNFRPNRPILMIRYMADSAGIGRKILFSDSLDPGDPFCTLERLHNSFCDDSELDKKIGQKSIFGKFLKNRYLGHFWFGATKATIRRQGCSPARTMSGRVPIDHLDTSMRFLDFLRPFWVQSTHPFEKVWKFPFSATTI